MSGRPAIEIRGHTNDPHLPLADAVAAAVDGLDALAIETPDPTLARVFFEGSATRDVALEHLAAALPDGVRVLPITVEDGNWAARSQAALGAIRAGRVVVAPPWALPSTPPAPGDLVVQIRPALGFGSGHHPTTRLALLGLQTLDLRGADLLDLGTGSGVLAIAAVRLGAGRVTGVDRDPDALASAQHDVAANGVGDRIVLRQDDIDTLVHPPVRCVAANLTGAALGRLASRIASLAVPGGHLVLGGILTDEADSVAAAYRPAADLRWQETEAEWVGMVWQRRR